MNKLPDLLHLLLCQEQHLYDMVKIKDRHAGICYFYLEEQIASNDPMADHIKWGKVAEKFKDSLGLSSDEEAQEFIRSCIQVSQELGKLVNGNEARLNFIHQLIL